MKYSISELLAMVDDGSLSSSSVSPDVLADFESDGDRYIDNITLCLRYPFTDTDKDTLLFLLELVKQYRKDEFEDDLTENPYCYGCDKSDCIGCAINDYGHPLWFDN